MPCSPASDLASQQQASQGQQQASQGQIILEVVSYMYKFCILKLENECVNPLEVKIENFGSIGQVTHKFRIYSFANDDKHRIGMPLACQRVETVPGTLPMPRL